MTVARMRRDDDHRRSVPVHAVWEITLACDLKCQHCGSRAGRRRPQELSTAECLEVVAALARLGTREVTLIGGEAYLRSDWIDLIRAVHDHGMLCSVQTGARNLTDSRIAAAAAAGLRAIGISIDGLRELHDELRGVPGSFDRALDAMRRARQAGLRVTANTQIGARTLPQLPALMDRLIEAGVTHWQIQLTVAMGNAVDHPELLLQPYELLEVMPVLAKLYTEGLGRGLLMLVGNNIGYFGPYEHLWRGVGDSSLHWQGCSAGQTVMGIEADGTVKGCPSLATASFAGGNVRTLELSRIWESSEAIHFGRLRSAEDLWGECRSCYYADVCRGGCTWTSHSLFGRAGNNPYCHYRALQLQKRGLRERIVKRRDAPNTPFAIGEFALVTERISDGVPLPGGEAAALSEQSIVPLSRLRKTSASQPGEGRVPPRLTLCRGCKQYVTGSVQRCPHCGVELDKAEAEHALEVARRQALILEMEQALGRAHFD